ncbi:hypothetical protein F5B20DRAFT_558299 [Whalleya microplaca]|nr:hypothetical protein F5B20DRAFT_558299 [Whalleya microplaca]
MFSVSAFATFDTQAACRVTPCRRWRQILIFTTLIILSPFHLGYGHHMRPCRRIPLLYIDDPRANFLLTQPCHPPSARLRLKRISHVSGQ